MTPRRNTRQPRALEGPADAPLTVELNREEWWYVLFACVGSPDRNSDDDAPLARIEDQIRYQLSPSARTTTTGKEDFQ
jgi:hypothetical protein